MSPEEYDDELERERQERNQHVRYEVREEYGEFLLHRRNSSRMSRGVIRYTTRETADLAAALLNRLKEDEAW